MNKCLVANSVVALSAASIAASCIKVNRPFTFLALSPSTYGTFSYKFTESTGPNQLIVVNGRDADIHFDGMRSNLLALHSLYALKWNVLYPNSSGRQITVTGTYNSNSGRFVLKDWHIRVPFRQIVVDNPEMVPSSQHTIISKFLRQSDFEKTPEFDSSSSLFHPAKFQADSDM